MPFFKGNKPRLYIAYNARGVRSPNDVPYHTSLLLVPKKPKDSSAEETWRFHATNPIVDGKAVWQYDGKLVKNRMQPLKALLFLGKVKHGVTGTVLDEVLQRVPITNDDETWRCRHWSWDAIQKLIDEGILQPLQGAFPRDLWQKGLTFANEVDYDNEQPVPTCDHNGKRIQSAIP